jgi:cytochrome c oxidase subunit 3
MSETTLQPSALPFGAVDKKGVGWWGVLTLIATEAALFAYLLFSFAFTAVQAGPGWLPAKPPSMSLSAPDTVILLASSVAVWWGERGLKRGRRGQLTAGLAVAIVLGGVFVAIQLVEWKEKTFTLSSSGYGSHYFTITGFHMMHVIVGMIGLTATLVWNQLGYFDARRNTAVTATGLYWHFVDVVWLCVFTAFYLTPYLGSA